MLSQTNPVRGEKYDNPPPRTSPPTPTVASHPPGTARLSASSWRYTSDHLAPAPTEVIVLSELIETLFKELRSMVTPPCRLEALVTLIIINYVSKLYF